jgi:Ca2+-binding RTX toxin-like protein
VVIEAAYEGKDTVQSSATYTLANHIEDLLLTGTAEINGTGNAENNILKGNSAANVLSGLGGDDTYYISSGDSVIEIENAGVDTIYSDATFILSANIEQLVLTGSNAIDGTGNNLNNVLTGNVAANVLAGQDGDDNYYVSTGDIVVESVNAGIDTVYTDVTYTLGANVENVTLTGNASINAIGNELNNTLTGNQGVNSLTGGAGDDTYYVGAGDVVTELAGEGIDSVIASTSFTLGANIENLTLLYTGSGIGNLLDNRIVGSSFDNTLSGGGGTDTLIGGAGNDIYIIDDNTDYVREFQNEGTDTVQVSVSYTLGENFENLTLTGNAEINGYGNSLDNIIIGNMQVNVMAGGKGNDIYVVDNTEDSIIEAASEGVDTVQSTVGYSLSDNVENLTLTGTAAINGTGNSANNIITGNTATNVLTGMSGDDTYIVDSILDEIVEAAAGGIDTVKSSASYTLSANVENLFLTGANAINGTGNSLSNQIVGNSGSNIIDGGGGDDTLSGGVGNDTYIFGIGSGQDVITDNDGLPGNIDTIQLSAGIAPSNIRVFRDYSNLYLTINGTNDKITITGWFSGLQYRVEQVKFEDGTVWDAATLIAYSALGSAGDDVLIGDAGNNLLNGLDGNDTLDGSAGNDTLIGGGGNDILIGGTGDDTYIFAVGFG